MTLGLGLLVAAALSVGAAQGAEPGTGQGATESAPRIDARVVEVLRSPERIRTFTVLRHPPVPHNKPGPHEELGWRGSIYPDQPGADLSPATVARVSHAMSAGGGLALSAKACLFTPYSVFRFSKGKEQVDAIVCFQCNDVAFTYSDGAHPNPDAGFADFGHIREVLLDAAQEGFPKDEALAWLRTPRDKYTLDVRRENDVDFPAMIVANNHRDEVRRCAEPLTAKKSPHEGWLIGFDAALTPEGKVQGFSSRDRPGNPQHQIVTCITKAMRGWNFSKGHAGKLTFMLML